MTLPKEQEMVDHLTELTGALADAKRAAMKMKDRASGEHIEELCKSYGNARIIKDMVKEVKTEVESINDILVGALHEAFTEKEISSVTIDSRRFTLSQRLFASVKKEDQPELYKWLRENGLEALIIPTVNASTLSAAVKGILEENKPISPVINTHIKPTVSVTRLAKKD